jgi:hypothetical protein
MCQMWYEAALKCASHPFRIRRCDEGGGRLRPSGWCRHSLGEPLRVDDRGEGAQRLRSGGAGPHPGSGAARRSRATPLRRAERRHDRHRGRMDAGVLQRVVTRCSWDHVHGPESESTGARRPSRASCEAMGLALDWPLRPLGNQLLTGLDGGAMLPSLPSDRVCLRRSQ